MALLPIRIYPDPVLRVRCREIETFDDRLRKLATDMVETMYEAPGVGLAASQVGVEERLCVVDPTAGEEEGTLQILVNPAIVADSEAGRESDVEGCLSIPGITEKVTRPYRIQVTAQDLDGHPVEFAAEGLHARVICHEVDHLNGVLFTDHLRGLRNERVKRHLKRLFPEEPALP